MIDLHRILVPTDFSKFSQNALAYAVAFAEKFTAELHLLHVVQYVGVIIPDVGTAVPLPSETTDQMTRAANDALARMVREQQLERFKATAEVREGTPFYEIVTYAREKDIDLIIMGTHGYTGLKHMLLGSVAEKVVRKAPCPVLTVRHPEHEFVHP